MRLTPMLCVLAMLAAALTGCQGESTVIVMVVTATPDPASMTPQQDQSPTSQPSPMPTHSAVPTAEAPVAFPTPTVREIYVAEQPFQRGRMFWLQPTGQIWVMLETEPGVGIWQVYNDAFREGDLEFDPSIVPPDGLLQPIRGFGTIWRANPEVRQALGWATDNEFGFVANYEYQPGGSLVEGEFVPGPGYHFLRSLYGDWFRFNEVNGTWQKVRRSEVGATPQPQP